MHRLCLVLARGVVSNVMLLFGIGLYIETGLTLSYYRITPA
jgi:hypothetical protein